MKDLDEPPSVLWMFLKGVMVIVAFIATMLIACGIILVLTR